MNTVQGIQEVSQEFKKCKCLEDVGGQSGILSRGYRRSVSNTVQRM